MTLPTDLTAAGNLPAGSGCNPALWYTARTWLFFTYIMMGVGCCLGAFSACVSVAVGVKKGDHGGGAARV